jgi:hypothetical protein
MRQNIIIPYKITNTTLSKKTHLPPATTVAIEHGLSLLEFVSAVYGITYDDRILMVLLTGSVTAHMSVFASSLAGGL